MSIIIAFERLIRSTIQQNDMFFNWWFSNAFPGGPFTNEKKIPPHIMEKIMERYCLSDPRTFSTDVIFGTSSDLTSGLPIAMRE